MDGIGPLDRPEPSPTSSDPGDPNPHAGMRGHVPCATIQDRDSLPLEDAAKGDPAHGPQVMVSEHRDNWHRGRSEKLRGRFGFHDAPGVRQVASDEQEISALAQVTEGRRQRRAVRLHVEVANCGDAHSKLACRKRRGCWRRNRGDHYRERVHDHCQCLAGSYTDWWGGATRDLRVGNKGLRVRLSRRALGAILVASAVAGRIQGPAGAADVKVLQVPAPSTITAKGVYVFDRRSGVPLFARDADLPLPPASLTKIVAALVVLERADLDQMITIEESDLVSPEESQVGLVAGDVLSARDLLFGALIPSGNDATLALARTIGTADLGEGATADEAIARFVEMMNEKAAEIGATSSHLVYPTGVDRDGHVMSARDVARAAAVALENPLFAEIVSTERATLPSQVRPEGYEIFTTNDLLVEGLVNGVKTGSTPQAGGCLATSFDLGPGQIVAVVLGSEFTVDAEGFPDYGQRFADTRTLDVRRGK